MTSSRASSDDAWGSEARVKIAIAGRELEPAGGEWLALHDPATGQPFAEAACGGPVEVDRAVAAARAAQPAWGAADGAERRRVLLALADVLDRRVEALARAETRSCGKPLRDARDDVRKSAESFRFYAGAADKLLGTTIPVSQQLLAYTLHEPVGVTAHVAPWNFPLRLAVRSVAPALAAGNTVVLKPAEATPVTAVLLARAAREAGLPDGVLNVVPGLGKEAGAALVRHPDVDHIAFTGSLETGREVLSVAAQNVVPVTPELGGKSPNVVFADADFEAAVGGALKAGLSNAGQVCCAGSRLLVHESLHDRFCAALAERCRALRLGPGLTDPDMGPLVSADQRACVESWVEIGREEGARLWLGGGRPRDPACGAGWFFEPTIFTEVEAGMRIAREEIFGPVLTVQRFRDEEEAVAMANDSEFGLVAGIWTRDVGRAHRVARAIHAGQIYVNEFFVGGVATPFGGTKRSGYGRERGLEALRHYTRVKSVCIDLGV